MMGLHQIFQHIRDVIHPPTDDELQTRYARLVGQAQEWAVKDCRYLTPEQMKEEVSASGQIVDLDELEVGVPLRITSPSIAGGFGLGFFEDSFDEDRSLPPNHYFVEKVIIPCLNVGVLLTYPDGVLLTPDRDGNVTLFKMTRDFRDFDPEAFNRLEGQIDEGYEYDDCAAREDMKLEK